MSFDNTDWEKFSNGNIHHNDNNINKIKELLNNTGCGFCLAKFTQVTMHLGTGMTHSCHHPVPHKIPLDEIEKNPAALFNTKHLKRARKEMLNNERPEECDYCWRIEDNSENSDRFFKSLETWALPDHDKVLELTGDEDIYPRYLEVSFSNACNLSCAYCGPEFSSSWVQELKQKGPMKIFEDTKEEQWVQGWQDLEILNYKNKDFNPYVDAFWKWFPEIYKHLKHYRITGGEPLMSKETLRSIDWFIENPNPDLEFSINTNLSVPDKLWNPFIEKISKLRVGDKVKKITIYTSVEGWEKRAEYARTGLEFDLLKNRFEEILKLGNIRVVVMATFNIFSITSIKELLEWIYEMKIKYNPNNTFQHLETSTGFKITTGTSYTEKKEKNKDHSVVVGIDIPYLRYPEFLDANICSHDLVDDYLIPALTYMSENSANDQWNDHQGFESYEIEKFKRIVTHRLYFNKKNDSRDEHIDIIKKRSKFLEFISVFDKRRGNNFLETFPEMKDFYNECVRSKKLYQEHLDWQQKIKGLSEEEVEKLIEEIKKQSQESSKKESL
jgi:pyruvate-formate lyase-activating enzyme